MAVSDTLVTVGTTPTLLANPGVGRDNADTYWVEVAVPAAGATIYIGGPNVTTTTGRSVAAAAAWSATLGRGDNVYAVVASGTQVVNTLNSRS